jgi:hypothetical protein
MVVISFMHRPFYRVKTWLVSKHCLDAAQKKRIAEGCHLPGCEHREVK